MRRVYAQNTRGGGNEERKTVRMEQRPTKGGFIPHKEGKKPGKTKTQNAKKTEKRNQVEIHALGSTRASGNKFKGRNKKDV